MEDPRLSRMYLALLTRRFRQVWRQIWHWCTMHFGVVMTGTLLLLCGGLVLGWRAHERGRFALLKSQLKEGKPYQEPKSPQPGGQDAVKLERTQISGGTMPEFLTATMLPGRGLDMLQISVFLPDKGEVDLLDAPSLEEAAGQMTGKGPDANGRMNLFAGGPLEVPWSGSIPGATSQDGKGVVAQWKGHTLMLPMSIAAKDGAPAQSIGGMLLNRGSQVVSSNVMPDGGEVQATFTPGDFERRWPSQTSVSATVLLSRSVLEYKVVVRNTGTEEEPMGIGWAPRFRILSGNRSEVLLKVPSSTRLEHRETGAGLPTGKFLPVAGTPYDFTARGGVPLGSAGLNETFVDLHAAMFDIGPAVELKDPKNNYGIRLTAMSSAIKAFHVVAPAGSNWVGISARTNFDDPLGREWTGDSSAVMTLRPGESMQWTVRLEIFALT